MRVSSPKRSAVRCRHHPRMAERRRRLCRRGDEEALHEVDAQPADGLQLALRLDAFRDDLGAGAMGERHQRGDDGATRGVAIAPTHQAHVDLGELGLEQRKAQLDSPA